MKILILVKRFSRWEICLLVKIIQVIVMSITFEDRSFSDQFPGFKLVESA